MKRSFFLTVIFIAVFILFSGCMSGKFNSTSSMDDTQINHNAAALPKGKNKIPLWFYFEGKERFEIIANLCEGFNKTQDEMEVIPEFIPFQDFKKRIITGMSANNFPDLVIVDNPDHAYFASLGMFADITGRIQDWPDKNEYFEGPMKSCTYNGRVYGIPFGTNCLALFYNKRMLEKGGINPPATWDELKIAARKLSGEQVKGIGLSAQNSEEGTFQFLPWLFSTGGSFEKLDSPESVKSFSLLTDLVKDGSMSREVINWSQADVMRQFAAEKIAMMVNGPWQIPELKLKAPNLEYGVVKIPKDKKYSSVLGGENLAITEGKNKDFAFRFLTYISKPEVVKNYSKAIGYFPPRKDVAMDEAWAGDPVLKVFTDEMQYAMPRGPHPQWPEISNILSETLQETLTQIKPPDIAAREAQLKLEKLFNK